MSKSIVKTFDEAAKNASPKMEPPPQAEPISLAERVKRRFAGLQVESLPIPARQGGLLPHPDCDSNCQGTP
jgi:hypothetical protein